jgi:alanyl-tRNA synthetase
MQYEQDADGNVLGDLPAQSVDTGLGLERMAVLLQDVDNVFETDLFAPLLARAEELTGVALRRGRRDRRLACGSSPSTPAPRRS